MNQLQQFFVGKRFVIPTYQRDYAWGLQQVQDLVEDIAEAIQDDHSHYLGTIVLAKMKDESYEIVDGQQRISTLVLLMDALLGQLDTDDHRRVATENIFVRDGSELRLDFGVNHEFVSDLLGPGNDADPATAGQRNLQTNHRYCVERATELCDSEGIDGVVVWLDKIKRLKIISFEEDDTGSAIRLFQTVNDRGLPLTTMDKSKALLVYYSNRFLDGSLDKTISEAFGRCFRAYDAIVEFVRQDGFRIDSIAREAFSDNELMRYHYLSYAPPKSLKDLQYTDDYDGYMRTVFDGFLKGNLKTLNANGSAGNGYEDLKTFIEDYVEDLAGFCEAFRDFVIASGKNERIYRLLVVLGLSVRLYPLAIRLFYRGLLDKVIPDLGVDLLECIEISDLRVYKTRGTDPGRDVGDISHQSRYVSPEILANGLLDFLGRFASDGSFQANLSQDVYGNRGLVHLLIAREEFRRGLAFSVSELRELNRAKMTREHILSQTPSCGFSDMGFDDLEDYDAHKNMIGNLTLLTQSENSYCSNRNPAEKLSDPSLYPKSVYRITRELAHAYSQDRIRPTKDMVRARSKKLTDWALGRWPLWG